MIKFLTVVSAQDIVWTYTLRHSRIPDLYTEIEVADEYYHTVIVKKSTKPEWREKINLCVVRKYP